MQQNLFIDESLDSFVVPVAEKELTADRVKMAFPCKSNISQLQSYLYQYFASSSSPSSDLVLCMPPSLSLFLHPLSAPQHCCLFPRLSVVSSYSSVRSVFLLCDAFKCATLKYN